MRGINAIVGALMPMRTGPDRQRCAGGAVFINAGSATTDRVNWKSVHSVSGRSEVCIKWCKEHAGGAGFGADDAQGEGEQLVFAGLDVGEVETLDNDAGRGEQEPVQGEILAVGRVDTESIGPEQLQSARQQIGRGIGRHDWSVWLVRTVGAGVGVAGTDQQSL